MAVKIDIEPRGIYAVLIGALVFVLLAILRDVVVLVFIAVVLSAAFNPGVTWMNRHGIPRRFSVVTIGLVVLGIAAIIGLTFAPLAAKQLAGMWQSLHDYLGEQLHAGSLTSGILWRGFTASLPSLPGIITNTGMALWRGAWGLLITGLFLVVMVFYMTSDEKALPNLADRLTPARWRSRVRELVERIEKRLGHWLRGQLILGLVVGTVVGIGLTLMGVKYALALGLIAGITELIPSFGPYIGMVPALIIAYGQNHWLALWVVVLFYGVQQLENNFLAPKILAKAVGIHPIVIIIALLAGARLMGVLGIAMAVPICIIVDAIVHDWRQAKPVRP
jgi:predicted PurR-regulated permease PerM